MLTEILNNIYFQVFLALSTIVGGIAALSQLLSTKASNGENVDDLLVEQEVKPFKSVEPEDYLVAVKNVEKFNLKNLDELNHQVIKGYICPILNNQVVGADEFERKSCEENIESIKKDIISKDYYLYTDIIFGLREYDFQKKGFELTFYYSDYNYDVMNISISEASVISNSVFIIIEDIEDAKVWKKHFLDKNERLSVRGKGLYTGSISAPAFIDKARIVLQIENCRLNTGWGDGRTLDIKIIGFQFENINFPGI